MTNLRVLDGYLLSSPEDTKYPSLPPDAGRWADGSQRAEICRRHAPPPEPPALRNFKKLLNKVNSLQMGGNVNSCCGIVDTCVFGQFLVWGLVPWCVHLHLLRGSCSVCVCVTSGSSPAAVHSHLLPVFKDTSVHHLLARTTLCQVVFKLGSALCAFWKRCLWCPLISTLTSVFPSAQDRLLVFSLSHSTHSSASLSLQNIPLLRAMAPPPPVP